ncbi:MAG: deoxyribodipyrimidine photo-lyase, partial [Vulcanococcus sp.]
MAAERWLFWHRRDLRLADNLGLAAAAAATPAVTGVFVLDPAIMGSTDMAPARVWFLLESVAELQRRWREAGSRLLVLEGDPAELLPRLAEALGAAVVAWNRDVEPYGRARDRQVAAQLQAQGRRVLVDWDQLLVAPEALKTGAGDPYRVYGPFLRNWRGQVERTGMAPVAAPEGLHDIDPGTLPEPAASLWRQLPIRERLPSLADLGQAFPAADLCPCQPGEAAAQAQLTAFCDGGALLSYEPGRNIPADAGTSGLSAALKFGTLSPRQAWAAAQGAK